MKCIFCDIASNKASSFKVWEDKNFFAFLDNTPVNPGHILLIPKVHYENVYEIPNELYIDLFLVIKKLSPVLKKATSAKRIGLAIEGFGVAHVHVHLVPVNKGGELNPERAQSASEEELQKMQTIFKKTFEFVN